MPTAPSPAAGDAGLSRIGQIAITVHDLERATAFYRDALRLPFLFAAPGLAFFQCQGVRLMLSRPEKPEFDRPSAFIYFQVDDIEATHRTLTARGVPFVDQPHIVHRAQGLELWMTFFRDPDQNFLALMSERRV